MSERCSFGQPVGQAQHPLAHQHPGQHCVDEAGCSLGHAASHFLFEPIEFLEKRAAIIPWPAVNLLLYHGILAPHARWSMGRIKALLTQHPFAEVPETGTRIPEHRPQ